MPDQNPKPNQSMAEDEKTQAMSDPGAGSGQDLYKVPAPVLQGSSGEITGEGPHTPVTDPVSLVHKTLAGGKYKVNEELGRGGMSVVYAATDLTLGRVVAVKVLLAEYAQAAGPEATMRFQQEARSVAKLSHPHIISIYEYGVLEDGAPFIVMDYIVGASLADEMEAHGLMSEERVLEIIKQSAEALRHSHTQGVVHRDIKPSNILLTKGDDGEDYVRIVDFGIAKMQTQDNTGKLTRTGQVFGSPLYMSPEQCEGLPADARSDIYSLGCVAYELITGRPPHVGKNVVETMHRKMTTEPTPFAVGAEHYKKNKKQTGGPSEGGGSQFSLAFQKIILKMLASDPANRQQSADELLNEIKQIKGKATEKNTQDRQLVPDLAPGRKAGLAPKLVAICVAVATGALLFYFAGQSPPVAPAVVTSSTSGPAQTKPEVPAPSTDGVSGRPGFLIRSDAYNNIFPLKGSADFDVNNWKQVEGMGQEAFRMGDLPRAGEKFEEGLQLVDSLNEPQKSWALDVSLSDAIDLALAQGKKPSQTPVWQRYQAMLQSQSQAISGVDGPLLRAMDEQLLAFKAGETLKPEVVNRLIESTFKSVRERSENECFGDEERLLNKAVPLLNNFQKEDGRLAYAYHNLSSVWAIKGNQHNNNWKRAIDYADLAVQVSKEGPQMQTNLAQAFYLKGWAQAMLKKDPVDSYEKALEIDSQLGAKSDLNRLAVLRKLAQYYQENGKIELAQTYASSGIKLAKGIKILGHAHARKLENEAFCYFVLGDTSGAIKRACDGLAIEDRTLPRQDYRVKEELFSLARYYKEVNQPDLADHVRTRARAIETRLKDFDKIYEPSAL
jgi:serine/threonine protein kinase